MGRAGSPASTFDVPPPLRGGSLLYPVGDETSDLAGDKAAWLLAKLPCSTPPTQAPAPREESHGQPRPHEGGMQVASPALPMPAREGKSQLGPCQKQLLLASADGERCLALWAGRQSLSTMMPSPACRWLQKLLYFPHTFCLECPPRHGSCSCAARQRHAPCQGGRRSSSAAGNAGAAAGRGQARCADGLPPTPPVPWHRGAMGHPNLARPKQPHSAAPRLQHRSRGLGARPA